MANKTSGKLYSYTSLVKNKHTGSLSVFIEKYPTKKAFLEDLRANGYTPKRTNLTEVYNYNIDNARSVEDGWITDTEYQKKFGKIAPIAQNLTECITEDDETITFEGNNNEVATFGKEYSKLHNLGNGYFAITTKLVLFRETPAWTVLVFTSGGDSLGRVGDEFGSVNEALEAAKSFVSCLSRSERIGQTSPIKYYRI